MKPRIRGFHGALNRYIPAPDYKGVVARGGGKEDGGVHLAQCVF